LLKIGHSRAGRLNGEKALHRGADRVCLASAGGGDGCGVADAEAGEQTFYRWKKTFAGVGATELRRLKQLEEENRKLKQLVADLSLDKKMLQDVLSKHR
jgi:putative transposase